MFYAAPPSGRVRLLLAPDGAAAFRAVLLPVATGCKGLSASVAEPCALPVNVGITYNYAGENIAMGYSSPDAVMTAWMNSAGHRANILSANFTTFGVGYVADGGYWTQWFIG